MALRVQPGARGGGLEGLAELADGAILLKAKVSVPAEAGRANEALIKLLAKTWGLPKSGFELLSGHEPEAQGSAGGRRSARARG